MGKQVQRIMEATSASLLSSESISVKRAKDVKCYYIRPQSNLNDYEGDIGAIFDACGVKKSADT